MYATNRPSDRSNACGKLKNFMPNTWTPDSWRGRPALQQAKYPSESELADVLHEISTLPPLVTSWEILTLKRHLAEASHGERFILQGGDCAEQFAECQSPLIANKIKILLQMSLVLIQGSKMPVTRVGRIAGQYAKPRSEDLETKDGVSLPSYRGDNVNRPAFTEADRRPDPRLLLRGHERAAMTLNFIRALVRGGFADLHHPEYWELDFMKHSPREDDYRRMTGGVVEALRFMENVLGIRQSDVGWVDLFTSHEGLHLPYEESQTRRVPHSPGWFNLSTHFPWVGMRTADPDGAHVEYFRGIENPLGVKVGAKTTPEMIRRICETLNPGNNAGRLTLIHRFGSEKLADGLPPVIRAVRECGAHVTWICDPMHGNTRTTAEGYKTRNFDDIERELDASFDIHAAEGTRLGGVHFELTGDDVTECVGGARGLRDADLSRAYKTGVDPRLNYEQALEMAMLIAQKMSKASR